MAQLPAETPTRLDICIMCGDRNVLNNLGVRGRPKRYCSPACAAAAQVTNRRFCQHCATQFVLSTMDSKVSYCQECKPATMHKHSLHRCPVCGKAFRRFNSRIAFCSDECAITGKGPRPICRLATCTSPVQDGESTNYWPKFCSQNHRMAYEFGTTPAPTPIDRQMQNAFEIARNSGIRTPPLDPWGRPWFKPATSQRVIKTEPKAANELHEVISYLKRNDTPIADWMWMLGPSFHDQGYWPYFPWFWNDIPTHFQRKIVVAVRETVRSHGYKVQRPSHIEAKRFNLLELTEDIKSAKTPKQKEKLQQRIDAMQSYLDRIDSGRIHSDIAHFLVTGVVPLPTEHQGIPAKQLRTIYAERNQQLWDKIQGE